MTRNSTPYSPYELDLIKAIPSNLYVSYLTGRRADTISAKRIEMHAVASRSFGMKQAKKHYKGIYLDIAKEHNIDVGKPLPKQSPVKKQAPWPLEPIVKSSVFVTIEINGITTVVTEGDKIHVQDSHVFLTRGIC